MNIPGQAKEVLKRIYGANNPLNFIEDAKITSSEDSALVELTLRVPTSCMRFVHGAQGLLTSDLRYARRPLLSQDEIDAMIYAHPVYATHALGEWGGARPGKLVPTPKQVIFSGPKTIVIWPDDTKTIVSVGEGDEYDEYDGFCAAIVKKMFGSTHRAKKFLDSIKSKQVPKVKKAKAAEDEQLPLEEREPDEVISNENVSDCQNVAELTDKGPCEGERC